ncbi:hypothetical protein [Cohnella sp. JJ-181]|uniref:hypothetical protein n=1 Tax=Cohnella rhizoplanae TaxID=2974897 RepID=UPI0022FF7F60|nr:hypothetical protein [Cohnella sp. JJ-181]CAI6087317.1 hypothetical protein COHCIP112018_05446 [Cohnella sp. JJ-181]
MNQQTNLSHIKHIVQSIGLKEKITNFEQMKGTTTGLVYRLGDDFDFKYILKLEEAIGTSLAMHLLKTYERSILLPKIVYAADDYSHMIYTYIKGTTHFNRGIKKNWLAILVKELFNKYEVYQGDDVWGRLEYPRESWRAFNEISLRNAKNNVANHMSSEDYELVHSLVNKLFRDFDPPVTRYLLHGDTGVHNFVFENCTLVGVIDPSPMAGPIIYDFIYAFCSSPDDIDTDTLFSAFDLMKHGNMDRTRLIEEVAVQLYCRIGLSIRHHPNDLSAYMDAWEQWKKLL